MKKRIGDLTLWEFQKICSGFRMMCYRCPLNVFCNNDDAVSFDDEVDLDGLD